MVEKDWSNSIWNIKIHNNIEKILGHNNGFDAADSKDTPETN